MADAAAQQRVRLQLAYQLGLFPHQFLRHVTRRVEPNKVQRTILRADFLDLRITFLPEILFKRGDTAIRVVLRPPGTAWRGPVLVVRVVEAEAQPLRLAGFSQLFHGVAGKG